MAQPGGRSSRAQVDGARPRPRQTSIYKIPAGEQAIIDLHDRILAVWPKSTESLWIETRHGRTHVLARGRREAPVLVLFHGAGSNALAWGADVPEFERHFRVYAVDTPGEPGRSSCERIPWEGDDIVEWLDDLLDGLPADTALGGAGTPGGGASPGAVSHGGAALGGAGAAGTPVLVAGISQGGYIALRLATARPHRVEALVLLAPGGVTSVRPAFLVRAITYSLLGRRGVDALSGYVTGDSGMPQVALDYMNLIYTHFRSRREPLPAISDEELRGLTMPVLLMAGSRDVVFDSAKTVARVERLVPGAEVRILPLAGHALINVTPVVVPFLLGAVMGGGRA